MKNLYSLLLLLCTFLFLTISSVSAQNLHNTSKRIVKSDFVKNLKKNTWLEVKVSNFIFKKNDENHRLQEFTALDALKLEKYFMKIDAVLLCESHSLNKFVRVISRSLPENKDIFNHRNVVDDLVKMGYVPVSLQNSYQRKMFKGKDCYEIHHLDGTTSDCDDCDKVKISKALQEKFKENDYGTEAMDFDMDQPRMDTDETFDTSDDDDQ